MSARNHKVESARKDQREGDTWVFAIKLKVQLVTGGVQNNQGPIVGQHKIDQQQSHVKNQKQAQLFRRPES
jgi:hypothetical protein